MRLLLPLLTVAALAQAASVSAVRLEVDARPSPLNIDSPAPRLSWQPASVDRGAAQSAVQVLVASSPERLARNEGDLWDSGRVATASLSLPFAGKPLASNQRYYWKLRLWDASAAPSAWSESATFSTALLSENDWRAAWIAFPETSLTSGPLPLFRKAFDLTQPLRSAVLHIAGLGFYEARINGKRVGDREFAPGWTNYRASVLYDTYDVSSLLRQGPNAIGVLLGNGFFNVPGGRYAKFNGSFGRPKLRAQLHLVFEDGSTRVIATDTTWKTSPGPITFSCVFGGEDHDARLDPAGWDAPGFDDSAWRNAGSSDQHSTVMRAHAAPPIRVTDDSRPSGSPSPAPACVSTTSARTWPDGRACASPDLPAPW